MQAFGIEVAVESIQKQKRFTALSCSWQRGQFLSALGHTLQRLALVESAASTTIDQETVVIKRLVVSMACMLCLLPAVASAGCVGPVINGQCTTGVYLRGHGDDDSYRGSSGQQYQYNRNNPVDNNRYNVDLEAQRRDQMNPYNVNNSRDRMQGQRGGGIWEE